MFSRLISGKDIPKSMSKPSGASELELFALLREVPGDSSALLKFISGPLPFMFKSPLGVWNVPLPPIATESNELLNTPVPAISFSMVSSSFCSLITKENTVFPTYEPKYPLIVLSPLFVYVYPSSGEYSKSVVKLNPSPITVLFNVMISGFSYSKIKLPLYSGVQIVFPSFISYGL